MHLRNPLCSDFVVFVYVCVCIQEQGLLYCLTLTDACTVSYFANIACEFSSERLV